MVVFIFFVVLSILILVHELGHFLVAKKAGILVEEFGFGLPPRIWGKKIGETIYSLNLLPFGGFVKLHGEDVISSKVSYPKRSFMGKSKKTRAAIVVAGVLMNFVLAVFAFAVVYSFSGVPRETGEVRVLEVVPGSPAQKAGIVTSDIVKSVGGVSIFSTKDFLETVEKSKGKEIEIIVQKDSAGEKKEQKVRIAPREAPPSGEGPLGVVISTVEIYHPPLFLRPFYGVWYGFKDALFWGKTVIYGFGKIFMELFSGAVPKDVAGPVGIFALTSQAAQYGIFALINFLGILSVNLAVLNIMPFPALDGGRLMFILIEAIAGRKVLPKVEALTHTIGMIILLALIFAVTASDIFKLINVGSLSGFLDSFLR